MNKRQKLGVLFSIFAISTIVLNVMLNINILGDVVYNTSFWVLSIVSTIMSAEAMFFFGMSKTKNSKFDEIEIFLAKIGSVVSGLIITTLMTSLGAYIKNSPHYLLIGLVCMASPILIYGYFKLNKLMLSKTEE